MGGGVGAREGTIVPGTGGLGRAGGGVKAAAGGPKDDDGLTGGVVMPGSFPLEGGDRSSGMPCSLGLAA